MICAFHNGQLCIIDDAKVYTQLNIHAVQAYEDLVNQNRMSLEFSSFSDGKEAVTKAANLLLVKYLKLAKSVGDHEEKIFTEPNMDEALKAISMFCCQMLNCLQ